MCEECLNSLRKVYGDVFKLLFDIRHNYASSAWDEATNKREFVDGEHTRLNGIENWIYKHRQDINTLLAHWEAQQKEAQS